jgi:hypothetical protein
MRRDHRILKLLVFLGVLCALILGLSATAVGWSEGDPPASTTGTHDLIVLKANDIAGSFKAGGGWVDTATALKYSHYPDEVYHDSNNHIYDVWGLLRLGAAPTAVKSHYSKAVTYLKAKDVKNASMEVGLMAHYYDDIWNPWHTNYEYSTLTLQALYHSAYENDVLTHVSDFVAVSDGFQKVTDAAAATKIAATTSHYYHWDVFSKAYSSGTGYSYDHLDEYTRDMLAKAANGLADLIYSIKLSAKY